MRYLTYTGGGHSGYYVLNDLCCRAASGKRGQHFIAAAQG
jgi:hypothetical protein